MLPYHRYGKVLECHPDRVPVGGTVTIEVTPVYPGCFELDGGATEAQIYPWTQILDTAIYNGTGVGGYVCIPVPVQVLDRYRLTFQVPQDALHFVPTASQGRFLVHVFNPAGPAWGWTRSPFVVDQSARARRSSRAPTITLPASIPSPPSSPAPSSSAPSSSPPFTPPPGMVMTARGTWVPASPPPGPSLPAGTPMVLTAAGTWVPASTTSGTTASTAPTGGSAGSFPVPGPGAPGAPPSPDPMSSELKVRWLVEVQTPIREGSVTETLPASANPGLWSGDVTIETSPPQTEGIDRFELIVSAQLLAIDPSGGGKDTPIPGEQLTFEMFDGNTYPSDRSRVLEVSGARDPLVQKLRARGAATGAFSATTDAEGKVYGWLALDLLDARALLDSADEVKGLRVWLGDPPDPGGLGAAATSHEAGLARLATRAPALFRGGGGGANPGSRGNPLATLWDILVDPFVPAVETFVRMTSDGLAYAEAGVARTKQRVVGFFLERFADFVLSVPGNPLRPLYQNRNTRDEARALVIGGYLGIPRGIWAMGRDQIQDLTQLFDLVKALCNFIADDPLFALEIWASFNSPITREVLYRLDPSFKKKVNAALAKVKLTISEVAIQLHAAYHAIAGKVTQFVIAMGKAIYADFEKLVGEIATDYLEYARGSTPYHVFIAAFIAGDILGYIAATIGLALALGVLTEGIGAALVAVSKVFPIARLLLRLIKVLQKIGDAFSTQMALGVRLGKNGIGRALIGLFRLLSRLEPRLVPHLIDLMEAANDMGRKVFRMLARMNESDDPNRVDALTDTLNKRIPAGEEGTRGNGCVRSLAEMMEADDGFMPVC